MQYKVHQSRRGLHLVELIIINNKFDWTSTFDGEFAEKKVKQADRPDFVTARGANPLRYDSHSSRPYITVRLKLPTRTLREQHQRVPIWNCSGWRLPRFTVTKYARLCGPIPRLIRKLAPTTFSGRSLTVTLLYGVRTFLPWPFDGSPATVWLASRVIVADPRH